MSNKIEDLNHEMQIRVKHFISLITIPYCITSTLRTLDEQIALYAQGRLSLDKVNELRAKAKMYLISENQNKSPVTNCDGIKYKSNHQGGNAIDIVPRDLKGNPVWPLQDDPRWIILGEAGEKAGLEWGGRWKFVDLPHYQLKE